MQCCSVLPLETPPFTIMVLSGAASFLCAQILTRFGQFKRTTNLVLVFPWTSPICPLLLWPWAPLLFRAQGSIYPPQVSALPLAQSSGELLSLQGSSNSPSKPRGICSGFVNILFRVTTIFSCTTWTCLCCESCKWRGSKGCSSSHLCLVLLFYVVLSHSTEVAVAVLCICEG